MLGISNSGGIGGNGILRWWRSSAHHALGTCQEAQNKKVAHNHTSTISSPNIDGTTTESHSVVEPHFHGLFILATYELPWNCLTPGFCTVRTIGCHDHYHSTIYLFPLCFTFSSLTGFARVRRHWIPFDLWLWWMRFLRFVFKLLLLRTQQFQEPLAS